MAARPAADHSRLGRHSWPHTRWARYPSSSSGHRVHVQPRGSIVGGQPNGPGPSVRVMLKRGRREVGPPGLSSASRWRGGVNGALLLLSLLLLLVVSDEPEVVGGPGSGVNISPTPSPRAVPPDMQKGTSAPTLAPTSRSSSARNPRPSASFTPCWLTQLGTRASPAHRDTVAALPCSSFRSNLWPAIPDAPAWL